MFSDVFVRVSVIVDLVLGIFVLAKTGYSASLIFYDAMLTDVTDPERMDAVSSHGYAWGYIGSCIPFVAFFYLHIVICIFSMLQRRCIFRKSHPDLKIHFFKNSDIKILLPLP